MSHILSIINEQTKLSPKELVIAHFITNNAQRITQMNIVELARETGVSPATISRFCRTFHFAGYSDFRMRLSSDLAQSHTAESYQDIVEGNRLDKIVEAIESNHIRSISDTTRIIDFQQLSRAIHALINANHIALFGMATSGIVAQDFFQKLVRIGKSCSSHSDSHMQITSAAVLSDRDVAVAISYSGETPETIDALQCAKERGCTTISLTKFSSSTLSRAADITLFTSSLEEGMRRGDMASRIAQLHMIDILFTGMVSERFSEYVPNLEQSYHMVKKYRKDKGR
jgi:DNA-binding MurR/RpiR family transcriptional regulator